jgi:hypothetical protein
MPFVEIGGNNDWVNIQDGIVTVSVTLRKNFKMNMCRFRFFYDKENKLFAIQEDWSGYKINKDGRIHSRKIPRSLIGKYVANWDNGKVLVDLSKKIEE